MISGKFRFHGYGALKYLFGHGKTYRFKNLSIRVAPNARRVHSRVSVVISKKVVKAAPKRNRVRRRVYEILRTNWGHIKQSNDFLLTVYDPNYCDIPHEQLEAEIIEALDRSHLWLDTSIDQKTE
jgi:ribonuclease P protein component